MLCVYSFSGKNPIISLGSLLVYSKLITMNIKIRWNEVLFIYLSCRQEMILVRTTGEEKTLSGVYPLWLVILGIYPFYSFHGYLVLK